MSRATNQTRPHLILEKVLVTAVPAEELSEMLPSGFGSSQTALVKVIDDLLSSRHGLVLLLVLLELSATSDPSIQLQVTGNRLVRILIIGLTPGCPNHCHEILKGRVCRFHAMAS